MLLKWASQKVSNRNNVSVYLFEFSGLTFYFKKCVLWYCIAYFICVNLALITEKGNHNVINRAKEVMFSLGFVC